MHAFTFPPTALCLWRSRGRISRCSLNHSMRQTCRRRLRASIPGPENVDVLKESLTTENQPRQILALIRLTHLPSSTATRLLHDSNVLHSTNRQVRLTAVATLGKLGVTSEADTLNTVLLDLNDDYSVRAAAANALGSLLPSEAGITRGKYVPRAVEALSWTAKNDENFIVRYACLVSLGNLGDAAALPTLIPVAENMSSPALEAAAAVTALGEIVSTSDVTQEVLLVVINRARDREDFVRAAVVRTLGKWKGVEACSVLERMRLDEARLGQSEMVRAVLSNVFAAD